jgi:hypothetical protein
MEAARYMSGLARHSTRTKIGTSAAAEYYHPMQKAKQYLELAEHYRSARLDTKGRAARHLLETVEHSYRVLAESMAVLRRSRKVQKGLAPGPIHYPPRKAPGIKPGG